MLPFFVKPACVKFQLNIKTLFIKQYINLEFKVQNLIDKKEDTSSFFMMIHSVEKISQSIPMRLNFLQILGWIELMEQDPQPLSRLI